MPRIRTAGSWRDLATDGDAQRQVELRCRVAGVLRLHAEQDRGRDADRDQWCHLVLEPAADLERGCRVVRRRAPMASALSVPSGDSPRWPPSHSFGPDAGSATAWACAEPGATTPTTPNATSDTTNACMFLMRPFPRNASEAVIKATRVTSGRRAISPTRRGAIGGLPGFARCGGRCTHTAAARRSAAA